MPDSRATHEASAPLRLALAPRWDEDLLRVLEREVLPAYVPTCRWFGGKGRSVRGFRIARQASIGDGADAARVLAVEVLFTDGKADTYLLPAAFVDARAAEALAPGAILAWLDGAALCDALHLPAVRADLLRLIVAPSAGGEPVRLAGSASARLDRESFRAQAAASRVLGADQSNTSITCGEQWFFKFYRKFERGPNPDVEITRFLSEEKRLPSAVAYGGALEWIDPAGGGTVGMLVGYTRNEGDGWTYTLAELARFFSRVREARVELNASNATALIGRGYLGRARQLARRTAEMHLALADGAGFPDFEAEPFTPAYQRELADSMRHAADAVFRQLEQATHVPDAAPLLASAGQLGAAFAHLRDHPIDALKTRIHGDFHLGQVLNTGADFVIIDFEGEPRLTLEERRRKRSPLQDVAGMLRSFDYAGAASLRDLRAEDTPSLEPWARAWVEHIAAAYLAEYLETVAGAAFLPASPADTQLLLDIYQLHKAIYEIGYELSYRPGWAPIPIHATRRLLARIAKQ